MFHIFVAHLQELRLQVRERDYEIEAVEPHELHPLLLRHLAGKGLRYEPSRYLHCNYFATRRSLLHKSCNCVFYTALSSLRGALCATSLSIVCSALYFACCAALFVLH